MATSAEPLIALHASVLSLVVALAASGGRALLVGGSVRDALMGRPGNDLDIEVHGMTPEDLRRELRRFGRVDEVGRAFGVFKLRVGRQVVDVSVPRRDSKVGAGHRGIHVEAEPHLGVVEAARRRDLTINAIAWDPVTGELIDPFDGAGDLGRRVLRAVDDRTFGEDPLRALRVAQFAARFAFAVVPELEALCSGMALGELPAERVRAEVDKLLLRGTRPSLGWNFAFRARIWERVVPEWDRPCPPEVDRVAALPLEGEPRRLALLLAAATPAASAASLLERLLVFRQDGYDVRAQVLALHGCRDSAARFTDIATRARHVAEVAEVELFAAFVDDPSLLVAADALGVARSPLVPLLSGRDLLGIGLVPGPEIGTLLSAVRERQLNGEISSPEAALAWARGHIR